MQKKEDRLHFFRSYPSEYPGKTLQKKFVGALDLVMEMQRILIESIRIFSDN
jgi:hypothetical protein